MRWFALLVCFTLFCGLCFAQSQRYVWIRCDDSDQWALMDNSRPVRDRQLGVFQISKDSYFPLDGDSWLAAEEPPQGAGLPPGVQRKLPTGVVASKVPSGNHTYYKGQEISKDQALALLAGQKALNSVQGNGKIPDDSKKIRISIIGSSQACAAPLAVAKKHPEFVTVDYRPEAWMITRQGFVTPKDPTIYIQQPGPDGADIRRLDGYEGDVAFEAVLHEVIGRKIAPNPQYDAGKDEGWYKKNLAPLLNAEVPWLPVAVVGGLLFYALWSRRKKIAL